MSIHFEGELDALKQKLLNMAGQAETAVTRSVKALSDRNDDLAQQVEAGDSTLDQLEMEVDEMAISLLAKAPLASELRLIAAAMKICHELERVGDEATTISRRARELNQEPPLKYYLDIPRMARLAMEILKEALDAFVNRDPARARAIIPRDKEVDRLNKQFHRELASYMVENPSTITRALHFMVVSKTIERIADHGTNIAEEVVFLCEGRDIRHAGKGAAAAPPSTT
jgi:phosphate transport system protein